ncbi:MAG: deoxyguanosinetriphosphate triphosphohydrolase [candidate division Zixibacteria bacterium]|jgi:dGTPase|nr:deoxyguanosinetriphosphate triphosphohydrolase [candidate division Zixibacteria bacterium]
MDDYLNSNESLQAYEKLTLAPYAAFSKNSRGRKHSENDHPYRTCYQRDRDRIIHSAAFRRLEYKTQVFVNHEGDHYRTRLTHTLEVAQISRTIARALKLNEDLAETIALAHDLGHTPFGHAGEDILDALMKSHSEKGFNHNMQSLRVVEQIERRYPGFPGLNLSYEVREGIVKHETDYDISEIEDYNPHQKPTLEAQIVDLADEIAYNCHDVDDGLWSGVLSLAEIMEVPLFNQIYKKSEKELPDLTRSKRQYHVIRLMINMEVTDLIMTTVENLKKYEIKTLDDVRRHDTKLLSFSENLERENSVLKKFLFERMYRHWRLIRMTDKARRILNALYEAYYDNPRQLPPKYAHRAEDGSKAQVIADYMAGMTDRFAMIEYKKLFDPFEKV